MVRADVTSLTERVDTGEADISSLEHRVAALVRSRISQADTAVDLQLHLEDLDDRSHRGLPEATGTEDLPATMSAIFRIIMKSSQLTVEEDRVHRALGPRSNDPERPRDVLCRLHRYSRKELILREAWGAGDTEFDGALIKILPDLSRATLQCRARLRHVLDLARNRGSTYRWGYLLVVTFRRTSSSFTLCTPADLPDPFAFLDVEPIQVPNWLQIIPRMGVCLGPPSPQSQPQACQQSPQRRSRAPSGDQAREA